MCFERAEGRSERGSVSTLYPVDVLAVVRLRCPADRRCAPEPQPSQIRGAYFDDDSSDDIDEDTGKDFAFIQSYDYVFANSETVPGHQRYTHEINLSCEYVYLSDVYELVPVEELLRPAFLVPNTTQRSERDRMQLGCSSKRLSNATSRAAPIERTHYFWLDEML